MTPREKAERVKQLLDDPVVRAVFTDLREQLVAGLEQTAMSDLDTQHEIALTLQLLRKFRGMLEKYAQEIAVDKAKTKQETFINRIRETYKL